MSGHQTPDRAPGPLLEEELILDNVASDPIEVGAIRNVGGQLRMRDSTGVFNPRTGGGGFDPDLLIITIEGGLIYSNAGALLVKAVA